MSIKHFVNEKLLAADVNSISELIRFMNQDKVFEKLRLKDTQLANLIILTKIWLEEKTRLGLYGQKQDIFEGVENLDMAETKYRSIHLGILRIENKFAKEFIDEYIRFIISEKISGIALAMIINQESKYRASNAVLLSRYLKEKGAYIDALILLETASLLTYACDDIYMELADMYIEANCLDKAFETLNKIENKDENIEDIIDELDKILNGEDNE